MQGCCLVLVDTMHPQVLGGGAGGIVLGPELIRQGMGEGRGPSGMLATQWDTLVLVLFASLLFW